MKSDLQKGALYLIDDEFRERCRMATPTPMPRLAMATGGEMATETALAKAPPTGMGNKYITKWKPYQNGIVFLAEIESHGNKIPKWDICKVCFNNSSGVRYVYRAALELAKRVDRM